MNNKVAESGLSCLSIFHVLETRAPSNPTLPMILVAFDMTRLIEEKLAQSGMRNCIFLQHAGNWGKGKKM